MKHTAFPHSLLETANDGRNFRFICTFIFHKMKLLQKRLKTSVSTLWKSFSHLICPFFKKI